MFEVSDMFELVSLSLTWFVCPGPIMARVEAAVRQLEEANTQLNVAALGQRLDVMQCSAMLCELFVQFCTA